MNYSIFKVVHLTGLSLAFMGLAGVLGTKISGGVPAQKGWIFRAAYVVGLLLLLASGIVLANTLGFLGKGGQVPGWLKAKFGIWLLTGASMALANRILVGRFLGTKLCFFTLLVIAAAWLAIFKPF